MKLPLPYLLNNSTPCTFPILYRTRRLKYLSNLPQSIQLNITKIKTEYGIFYFLLQYNK